MQAVSLENPERQVSLSTSKRILIVPANPINTNRLHLDQEVREIQEGFKLYKRREQFEIIAKWTVRTDDLRRALLDYEPQIVHFSGYGPENQALAFEDNTGQMQLVSSESLARLFRLFKDKIECVLLNACYNEVQAEAISQYINYVAGMNSAIGDRAAINFAVGFYDALGAGLSYEEAYEFGCSAIALENIPESVTPVLKSKKNLVHDSQTIQTALTFFENPEGQVPLDSPFYIERPPIEANCYETILKPGALIRIKAPRQMGQISLMMRILNHAHQNGYQTASLNFQSADTEFFTSLDRFLQWFCASIAFELNLPDNLNKYWKGVLGSRNKCTNYFQRYLLPTINTPIALGLYEIDEVFQHPIITTDFFGLLRAWHEMSKTNPVWSKLRLIIVHSKEVYIPLNINQSPFNVGLPIELPCFNQMQVQDLVERHGLNWSGSQVEELMALVDGHPYLLRVALYEIARGRITLAKLQQIAVTEESPYSGHLRRHWLNLQTDPELLEAIKQVVTTNSPVDVGAEQAFKLRSMGLVKFQGNDVIPLCNLYRQYFLERLGINSEA
ncbi:AAA-like domain-containing protein [Nostocaceae cyanobacterium CENA369]|uniref:AAA-like domain-containing protein n=1 Tax=Dendronalium phyllosphericum CENA369 TaxID=1725256 RepID=A0A8J7I509_9NOST|nr:AAA-like domain-containing protein [Dendronalium phyllosphericum CENA369]